MKCRALILLLIWIMNYSGDLLAQPDSVGWEVGRVYVPVENQQAYIPPDYWPIDVKLLDEQLERLRDSHQHRQVNPTTIDTAIYLATINRDLLVSDGSVWTFGGSPQSTSIPVGRVSFALRDAKGLPEDRRQLSIDQRFTADGSIEVDLSSGQSQLWFGFQAASNLLEKNRSFNIQIPRSGLAKMLISADKGLKLTSPEVVIASIASPADHLPEDWPASLSPRPSPRQSWWLVYLSGTSQFSINVAESIDGQQQAFAHAISSAVVSHQINTDFLSTTATFEFATESNGQPIALDLDHTQKIRSISVDGKLIDWRTLDSNENRTFAQLAVPAVSIGTVVEVQTVTRLIALDTIEKSRPFATKSNGIEVKVPSISVANATVLSGKTTIRGDETTAIAQVASEQEFRKSTLDPTSLTWQSQWSGWPATATARLLPHDESWSTSSFCRLNVQDRSVLAQIGLSITGSALRSNQLRLPVHSGWSIDSVQFPKDATNQLHAFTVNDSGREEVVITWQGQPNLLNMQLQIIASSQIEPQSGTFSIQNPRIVVAPDIHSPAYWVIQNSSNFRLRSNVDLLTAVVAKRDLATWQQQLLPEENLTVYRDLSDANSRFTFDAATGWITANIATVVEPMGKDRLKLTTQVSCQPNSGSVDRVELELPHGSRLEDWKFLYASGSEAGVPVQANFTGGSTEASARTVELKLPVSASNPFRLQASLELALKNHSVEGIELPVLGMPAANSVESIVILPIQLAHFSDQTFVELLTSASCCSTESLEILGQFSSSRGQSISPQENWVTARVDGGQAHLLTLSPASANQRSSWIWSESLVHDLTKSGYCRHLLELDIQTGSANEVAVNLPQGWQPDLFFVDDVERQDFFWQAGKLEINLPENRRSRLKIQFHSKQPTLDWFTQLAIDPPRYEVPVLQRSEQLKLPLANMALVKPSTQSIPEIIDRLKPSLWWQVFTPSAAFPSLDQRDDSSRPTYELSNRQSGEQNTIWILHRDALATLLLTALLIGAVLNWFLIHKSVRIWWIYNLTVVILVIVFPEPFATLGQVLLLAALLATVIRLIEVVTQRSSSTIRQSPLSSPRAVASLLLALMLTQPAVGQSDKETVKEKQTKIFGVVIPYEGTMEDPKGEYAWIPKELRDILPNAGSSLPNKQSLPKILSANYVLKMRQNPRDNTPLQELSVELKILATDNSTDLLLPYLKESLILASSPELNGQPRLPGIRYFELSDEGILFRPDTSGIMTVVLSFQPVVEFSGDQKYKFNTSLPPIPNATLRIVPNSQTSGINVNARGGMQRLPSGDYIAHLGAIDQLQMEWAENDRSTSTIATEYTTETWVRSQSDTLSVACQLTIERGRSLPEEFELIIDADWEPVGTKWGDADLISSTISATLKRRVVRIRLPESAGTTCRVRMLLAHRSNARTATLDVPFVSLDRVASKGKLFWWSPDPSSSWSAEGLESMPIRTAVSDWGELKIAADRTGYQVVGTGVRMRHQSTNASNGSLVELTALHVFSSHTELEYEATWERAPSLYEELVVNVPDGSEFKRLEINGKASTTFSRQTGTLRIPLASTTSASSTRLKIVFELPPMQGVVQQLPRIHLSNLQTRQANYQIYRGTGLDVQLLPTNSGLVFTGSTSTSRRPNLEKLETLVGEANLPPEMLNEPVLAAKLDICSRPAIPHQSFIQYISRTGNGWKATVRCAWDAEASGLDYAFFDLPLSLRDSIETGTQVCIFKPHEDPTRTNLCIPIPPQENGASTRSVEFSFSLTAVVQARSITLPRISANHGFVSAPIVALPKTIDEVEVRWARNGRPPEASWFEQAKVARRPDLEYLSLLPNQTKLVWQSGETGQQDTRVELLWLDVTSNTTGKMAGIANYWLAPKRQVTQQFEVPTDCEILGVDCGNRRTTWSVEGNTLRVTLQPNSVPLSIRIMAQWNIDSTRLDSLVQIPKPLNATVPSQLFLSMSKSSNWSVINGTNVTSINSDAIVDNWAAIVIETADSLASMPERQSSNWLANWYPANYRIRNDILIDLPISQAQLSAYDTNDDGEVSVGELWDRTETLARNADYSIAEASPSVNPSDFSAIQWRVEGIGVRFSQRSDKVRYDAPRWLAALGLAGLGILGLLLGPSLKNWLLAFLATQPWFYWTLLSILLWFALPISWPSWFVFGISLWMWITQLIDNRRRTRRFGF